MKCIKCGRPMVLDPDYTTVAQRVFKCMVCINAKGKPFRRWLAGEGDVHG